jgi:hypothetical protein
MTIFLLFSTFFMTLFLGIIGGWVASEKFTEYLSFRRHHFEELFEKNPHPELIDDEGNIDRGEYITLNFEPGYDPDDFDPGDLESEEA